MNKKQFLKDGLMWGVILWLIGYVLGIALFSFVPSNLLGWIIMPIGIIITLLVLSKKIKGDTLWYYLGIAAIWTILAVILDYVFNVKLFKIVGYYKLDIYLYYIITFILPLIVGALKLNKGKK
jgi:hypothetical protein